MDSIDDISKMFSIESEKLTKLVHTASAKESLSIPEIIETYYQVMNVSSMISMLKQQISHESESFLLQLQETEKFISEKFDSFVHFKILEQLTVSIQDITKSLQENSGEKSKEEIESESKKYDELRKTMSTKEFVEQYAKGLTND